MGVRCTLLGHTYGDTEVEREREERGDEALVTIREVKTCARCGDRSVVSENKEVTSVEPPAEGPPPASDPDDAEPAAAEPAEPEGPEHDPETDDGVILDAEPEDEEEPQERGYGEWPDAEENHASAEADPVAAAGDDEPAEWPDAEGEDEGYDASAPSGDDPDVEYPQGPTDDAPAESTSSGDQSGGASAGSDFERVGEAAPPTGPTSAGTELHCPACGYRDSRPDGSLREGDVCPECKKGYLAARE